MSQINRTAAQAPVVRPRSLEAFGPAIAAIMALAAAVIVAALMLTPATAPSPSFRVSSSDLTDGYLPGAIAAYQAAQIANAQRLNGGWQGRLSVGTATASGALKEGGRLGINGVKTNVIDGWAGLIPE